MSLDYFDLAAVPPAPWKNGGGSTRELACWPPGAGMDDLGWRVSVATIAAPGPFSAFAGVDRQIMLLEGDGVQLASPGWQHTLNARWQPFAFSGDAAVDCTLLGGVSTDFNLMLRRGVWSGCVQVLHDAPPAAQAGLCMVLSGRWQHGERMLQAGQGLWWMGTALERIAPLPEAGDGGLPTLAWVALESAASEKRLNEICLQRLPGKRRQPSNP
jgi:environmental stress-induced protein Ves